MSATCAGILVCGGIIARGGQPFGSFFPLVHSRRMLCFYLSSKQSSVAGPAPIRLQQGLSPCARIRLPREALRYVVSYVPLRCSIASVASSTKGIINRFIYTASKAAVLGITKSVAADYISVGVRCNAICPGTIQSPSLEQRLSDMGDYQLAKKQFVARQPMGRFGEAEEVANLAVYLASDASAFTTGQFHIIDGGICM